jgi:hypothetical protein
MSFDGIDLIPESCPPSLFASSVSSKLKALVEDAWQGAWTSTVELLQKQGHLLRVIRLSSRSIYANPDCISLLIPCVASEL